jgi:endonuclease/exonuclease/phosphatase (EEP) superfamily protein YafD
MSFRSSLKRAVAAAAVALAACVIVPQQQHALVSLAPGSLTERSAVCGDPAAIGAIDAGGDGPTALDPAMLRLASWNLHKQQDSGWQEELSQLASRSDVLLLQEAGLTPELRDALGRAGYSWLMASSFAYSGIEYGVMIAARARPSYFCTGRAFEPLLGIPKSFLVARFRLAGRSAAIEIATVHTLNFVLELGPYEAQLDALGEVLAAHAGPIVLAGDFNTWSEARERTAAALAARLALEPVIFPADTRSRFLGRPADWAYARGADVLDATAPIVTASDHNPLLVTLRIR